MTAKIKIIYCTYPSLYSSHVFKKLQSCEWLEIVAIIHSKRIYKKHGNYFTNLYALLKKTGFKYLFYQFCVTDLFTLLMPFLPIKSTAYYAKKNKIPITTTMDINQKNMLSFIKNKQADWILTAHFNQRLKAPVISLANYGSVNIHPSFLPYYKGIDPVFYQLLDQQQKIAVSVHHINEALDTGDIISQKQYFKVSNSLLLNNLFLFNQGTDLFINSLKTKNKKKQLQKDKFYDSWPTATLVNQFCKKNALLKGYIKAISSP